MSAKWAENRCKSACTSSLSGLDSQEKVPVIWHTLAPTNTTVTPETTHTHLATNIGNHDWKHAFSLGPTLQSKRNTAILSSSFRLKKIKLLANKHPKHCSCQSLKHEMHQDCTNEIHGCVDSPKPRSIVIFTCKLTQTIMNTSYKIHDPQLTFKLRPIVNPPTHTHHCILSTPWVQDCSTLHPDVSYSQHSTDCLQHSLAVCAAGLWPQWEQEAGVRRW